MSSVGRKWVGGPPQGVCVSEAGELDRSLNHLVKESRSTEAKWQGRAPSLPQPCCTPGLQAQVWNVSEGIWRNSLTRCTFIPHHIHMFALHSPGVRKAGHRAEGASQSMEEGPGASLLPTCGSDSEPPIGRTVS